MLIDSRYRVYCLLDQRSYLIHTPEKLQYSYSWIPWYPMNVPLTVRAILSAIGVGSFRSCALVILALSERVCISLILCPSLATDDWWLITTNPITERIESMVMTTMSSVRVNHEVLLKDEILLEGGMRRSSRSRSRIRRRRWSQRIISRERLREKRDIEILLKNSFYYFITLSHRIQI